MRSFFALFVLLLDLTASAATLNVEVNRHGFAGPIDVAVAPRVDGRPPKWLATKTLAAGKSAVNFDGLAEGLYIVLATGPEPLQRLSAKANVGSDGATLRLDLARVKTELRATMGGQPIARARITLTHDALRWTTKLETGEDGRFAGELWEPARYIAHVNREQASAPHSADVWVSGKPLTIDVPDRHVRGRILAADGTPLAGAVVNLRSENDESTLTTRTHSAADGRFEFFGVREGALALSARAPSYLDSDPVTFELHGAAQQSIDVTLTPGAARAVRVIDARDVAIAGATLITSCDGHVKSTAITNGEGRAEVALPGKDSCAIYVLPKEGSIAVGRVNDAQPLVIRVPEATSSLRLALKSEKGEVFSDLSLLMRIDGMVIPPAVARLLGSRGFPLMTDDDGTISLKRIPPGTYEFWPYRTTAEGNLMFEVASEFAAPISVKVLTGENIATVKFAAR